MEDTDIHKIMDHLYTIIWHGTNNKDLEWYNAGEGLFFLRLNVMQPNERYCLVRARDLQEALDKAGYDPHNLNEKKQAAAPAKRRRLPYYLDVGDHHIAIRRTSDKSIVFDKSRQSMDFGIIDGVGRLCDMMNKEAEDQTTEKEEAASSDKREETIKLLREELLQCRKVLQHLSDQTIELRRIANDRMLAIDVVLLASAKETTIGGKPASDKEER